MSKIANSNTKVKASEVPVYNISKIGIPFTKLKSQIILMMKNNFRSHITINYDISSSACIDLAHVEAKNK